MAGTANGRRVGLLVAASCALAALAAAISLTAGSSPADDSAGNDASLRTDLAEAAAIVADGPEPWALRAAEAYVVWAGTPAEQQAAEVVVAFELNGGYSRCMADRGFPRPWQDSVARPPVYKRPLLATFWAAGPSDGAVLQEAFNYEAGQRQELRANSIEATGVEATSEKACRDANPGAGDDELEEIRDPSDGLFETWTEAMQPVVEAGGWFEPWETCMRAAEEAYSSADWECRRDVRAGLGDEVDAAVADFTSDQAAAIAGARIGWDAIAARAAQLGWTPPETAAGRDAAR